MERNAARRSRHIPWTEGDLWCADLQDHLSAASATLSAWVPIQQRQAATMATLTCSRSDLFPPTATVTVHPLGAKRDGQAPCGAAVASGTVDAAGALSITDSDIVSYTGFVLYSLVGTEHRYAIARSTADTFTAGTTWKAKVAARRAAIGTS